MKFYGREKELDLLKTVTSKNSSLSIVVGRRRIGKTTLLLEFSKNKGLYFFFSKNKTESEIVFDFLAILKSKYTIQEYIDISTLSKFFEFLFDVIANNEIIILDEFQRILTINKSFIYDFQKLWDLKTKSKKINLFISGSSIGMLNEMFFEESAPLYKRNDLNINLKSLDVPTTMQIMSDLKISDFKEKLKIYFIFEGIPFYYRAMETYNVKTTNQIFEKLIFNEFAPLKSEILDIVIEELGKLMPTHFGILEAISKGKNNRKEIADFIGLENTSLSPYLHVLVDLLEFVKEEKRVTDDWKRSKITRYILTNNFFIFWFRFVYKYQNWISQNNYSFVLTEVKANVNDFYGFMFEKFIREKFIFGYEKVSRWWGVKPITREQLEIDIVALTEKQKEILFCECKWKENVNAEKIAKELIQKSEFVDWKKGFRKETYYLFAISFTKKINSINGKPIKCFDLKDLEIKFNK